MSGKRDNPGVVAPPPLIALAALVIAAALDWLLPLGWIAKTDPSLRYAVGVLLCIAGIILLAMAARMFRKSGTNLSPFQPTTALASDGIYRYTRNPIYIAFGILLLAIGLFRASDWMFPALVLFGAVIHYGVVLREEKYLRSKFGESYDDYTKRVPRYIHPF